MMELTYPKWWGLQGLLNFCIGKIEAQESKLISGQTGLYKPRSLEFHSDFFNAISSWFFKVDYISIQQVRVSSSCSQYKRNQGNFFLIFLTVHI